jgi:hypothetical protein
MIDLAIQARHTLPAVAPPFQLNPLLLNKNIYGARLARPLPGMNPRPEGFAQS